MGRSIDEFVISVAAARLKSSFADLPSHFGFVHMEARPGCLDDILFKHGAAEIVDSVLQGEPRHGSSLGDPGSLDVVDIIEQDAGECDHPEVFVAARPLAAEAAPARLEIPG